MTVLWLWVAVFLLSACSGTDTPTPPAPDLVMKPELSMEAGGEMVLRLGVNNAGDATFPGSEVFDAVITIVDGQGEVRKETRLEQMNPVPSGQTLYPSEERIRLKPGDYTFTWATPGYTTVTFDFKVVERDGDQVLQAPIDYLNPFTEYTEVVPSF
jgi:hypothetical protein